MMRLCGSKRLQVFTVLNLPKRLKFKESSYLVSESLCAADGALASKDNNDALSDSNLRL